LLLADVRLRNKSGCGFVLELGADLNLIRTFDAVRMIGSRFGDAIGSGNQTDRIGVVREASARSILRHGERHLGARDGPAVSVLDSNRERPWGYLVHD